MAISEHRSYSTSAGHQEEPLLDTKPSDLQAKRLPNASPEVSALAKASLKTSSCAFGPRTAMELALYTFNHVTMSLT